MKTLLEYIKELNAKSDAWVNEVPGRWASNLTEDLSHWTASGITTAEELAEYLDAACEHNQRDY